MMRVSDEPISCCAVFKGEAVVFCDVVFSCKGIPMEEIPLVYSVNVEEFNWLFGTVVAESIVPLLWKDLSCPCRMFFVECILLDKLR